MLGSRAPTSTTSPNSFQTISSPLGVTTEGYITHDGTDLYVAFVCHDPQIGSPRASFTDRDGIFDDDFVGIVLDTYRDHKRAYAFFSNAHGIQGDMLWYANRAEEDGDGAIWQSQGGEDGGFDAVWESAARTYEDRWVEEMRIPRLRTDADDLIVHQRIFCHGLQYQFTRELFIRFVGELNRTRRATAVDAYESSTSYSFEPMLSYRMDAFSVFLSWG